MGMPFHPLANIFPLIEGREFEELVASIRSNGLRDPIVVYDGMVLDGRNRQRACEAADIACTYQPLPDDADPLDFVIDKNLRRRHLDESQRAYAAAKLANLTHGGNRTEQAANLPLEAAPQPAITQEKAATLLNVSERSVRAAKAVQEHGTPELQQAVERGTLPVSAAEKASKLAPETQRRIAEEAEAGRANVVRTVIKKESRDAREIELAARQRALPDKKYGVILADPEWRFEPYSRETGMDRAPENHYSTSDTLDIIARPVASIAANDAVLWLWATAPMLPQALAVMKGWGFEYKTHRIWHKIRSGDGRGSGYWFTGEHELILIGTRGAIPAPATAVGPSIFQAPAAHHSAKPECIAELIEQLYPNLPKIELNRRGPAREGWDAWGNEAESESEAQRDDLEPKAPRSDELRTSAMGPHECGSGPPESVMPTRAAHLLEGAAE